MADRILGMGDVMTLVEKAQQELDEKEVKHSMNKMMSGSFDLNDMLAQMKQVNKLGSLGGLLKLIPGMPKITPEQQEAAEREMRNFEVIINSMTKEERKHPDLFKYSRKQRVALVSGRTMQDVNKVLKKYEQMKEMMKRMDQYKKTGRMPPGGMAGMGGMLIQELLGKDYHHSHSIRRYILQPRKHVGRLRYWLLDNDFTVVHEDLAREGKFIWPILTVESFGRALFVNADPNDVEFEYPLTLLEYRNELTEEYLKKALRTERLKLKSKSGGSLTTFEELRTQKHRVSRLEYMVARL